MAVVDKTTLKGYFEAGKVPQQRHYVDLIDTMGAGDMVKQTYDTDADGIVDAAEAAPWAGITGKPATFPPDAHNHDAVYVPKVSANRPGVYRLYRREQDDGYSIQTYWTGSRWRLQGYYSDDTFHAQAEVSHADSAGAVPWAGVTDKPGGSFLFTRVMPAGTNTAYDGDLISVGTYTEYVSSWGLSNVVNTVVARILVKSTAAANDNNYCYFYYNDNNNGAGLAFRAGNSVWDEQTVLLPLNAGGFRIGVAGVSQYIIIQIIGAFY